MKKTIFLGLIFTAAVFGQVVFADTNEATSRIEVFSRNTNTYTVYINEKQIGETPIIFNDVQPGSYYLKVVDGDSVVHEEILKITDKQVSTVVVPPLLSQTTQIPVDDKELKKIAPLDDYSLKVLSGPYIIAGYQSASYYFYDTWDSPDNIDKNASTLGLGLGYRWGIVPHIDLSLEVNRAEYSGWYAMPITACLYYNFPYGEKKEAKWYYGIGYGYNTSNLSRANGSQLSMLYGVEYPSGKDAVTFDYLISSGKVNEVSTFQMGIRFGYRWNYKPESKVLANLDEKL